MTPIPLPSTAQYTPGPLSPDSLGIGNLTKEGQDVRAAGTNATISTLNQNPSVIITKDSLDVPLEFAFHILNERTNFTRPSAVPLFRTRNVEGAQTEEPSAMNEYQKLRNGLGADMKARLEENEKLPFSKQDHALVAFDQGLRFQAASQALAKYLGGPDMDPERAMADAATFKSMPETAKKNAIHTGQKIANHVDKHLEKVGPNDPSFDLLSNASGLLKEAIGLLKLK